MTNNKILEQGKKKKNQFFVKWQKKNVLKKPKNIGKKTESEKK